MGINLRVVKGDITKLQVDAIVNAANNSLLGGGGVDGAIHRAAGPELLQECLTLGGCKTGQAKITRGYNLPAKYVIHTVGPVYDDEGYAECVTDLTLCYANCLLLAKEKGIHSIAFPAISTGIYGFPLEKATDIATYTVFVCLTDKQFENYDLDVTFCCFNDQAYELYNKYVNDLIDKL